MSTPPVVRVDLDIAAQDFHALLVTRQGEITTAIRHQLARVDIPNMVEQTVVKNLNAMVDQMVRDAITAEVERAVSAFRLDFEERARTALQATFSQETPK